MYPIVSIVMAINADNEFLDQAIGSILAQSYEDFEFIIIANGCTDNLWHKLKTFDDNRIKLHRVNLAGFVFALNYGINISVGKYIARMDADDISLPDRIATQVDYLESNPLVTLVSTACQFIDENDNVIESRKFKIVVDNINIRKSLPFRNPILHAAMMVRKDALVKIGGYKYGFMSEDHELFLRMARDNSVVFSNINKVLYLYRRHKNQNTDLSKAKNNYYEISAFLFSYFLRTKNYKFIIGMLRVHPLLRKIFYWIKRK
ncbi:glycosyltransferase [Citrobacter sp. Cf039]|uniref:glycosyltransferase n=1 Tax=Citrobacter TaxID=544 RepID=UPI001C700355|nr:MULTISPECIES: glycosyltransferase [Citrobacter]EJB5573592.1 glycosyltransferase [Citrobacter freundii]MBW9589683.1 glycosyltransferase [Citrobacter freundii]MDM3266902.1 glycosyltransferase [Citrobacter sp. Cf039]MDM3344535.1 glycosyltransferase [Citrobacter sp. Cf115]MDS0959124.1 glycosyltransferase [Citrobacter freundii]